MQDNGIPPVPFRCDLVESHEGRSHCAQDVVPRLLGKDVSAAPAGQVLLDSSEGFLSVSGYVTLSVCHDSCFSVRCGLCEKYTHARVFYKQFLHSTCTPSLFTVSG